MSKNVYLQSSMRHGAVGDEITFDAVKALLASGHQVIFDPAPDVKMQDIAIRAKHLKKNVDLSSEEISEVFDEVVSAIVRDDQAEA